jgi:hypothetical protein
MKVRKCLVSNSSSSSFILACKNYPEKFKIEIEIDMNDLIQQTIDNEKDWIEYLKDEYCHPDDINEWSKEEQQVYKNGMKLLRKNQVLLIGSVSCDDNNPLSRVLYDNGFKKYIDNRSDLTVFLDVRN